MAYRLGIDTGGTYTDAVLVNEDLDVLHTAKSLTTRHDLSVGIAAVLSELPTEKLSQVQLVSLSTTLATNSVVEGYGGRVCVLLAGYSETDKKRSKIGDLLGSSPCILISGAHDAHGSETVALDLDAAKRAILEHKDSVSAFAVSGYFSVRNPSHELKLTQLIRSLTDKPVTSGHELASGLDATRRALTSALNARMSSYIYELLKSVKCVLKEQKIQASLMVVKGDGSLINASTATLRPIETILSGPAASVIGACHLSGKKDAIVVDMGGTTTDIAIVKNGRVDTSSEGSVIGGWRPMTEAVKVYSIGLGGDSEIRFQAAVGVTVGPRRVIPLSLLCFQYPSILEKLQRQYKQGVSPRQNRFAVRFQHDPVLLSEMDSDELDVWESLENGPLELEILASDSRSTIRVVARMQRKGLLIYSGFTPSDAAHVLGLTDHWSADAAKFAALIWARQMRRLYGCGQWVDGDAIAPCESVLQLVSQRISEMIINSGLNHSGIDSEKKLDQYARVICSLIFDSKTNSDLEPLFSLMFAKDHSLIGVGAPVHCYMPETASHLALPLVLPRHAEVANAIGAVVGQVIQCARVTITQPASGQFIVHTDREAVSMNSLDRAYEFAEDSARDRAQRLSITAGANIDRIEITRKENAVNHDIDGFVFFESTVVATAIGVPILS